MDNAAVGKIQKELVLCRVCQSELKEQPPLEFGPDKGESFMFCTHTECPLMGRVIKDRRDAIVKSLV